LKELNNLKEAEFWHGEEGLTVRCDLCPHGCLIAEGQSGRCRSRKNIGGKLYSLAYGRPCSIAIDPIEKKPLSRFMPGTQCLSIACTGCNLRCLNCQNYQISQASPDITSEPTDVKPQQFVEYCLRHRLPTIAFTYTEPLTYIEYTRDTAQLAHRQGIKNVLVSAGYVNETPLKTLLPYLDAANIDLKTISDATYRHHCGASLAPVLRTLNMVREAGVHLEITHLIIPTVNDSDAQLSALCQWLADNGFADTPLHLTRFFPTYRFTHQPPTPLATMHRAERIAQQSGIADVLLGNC